MDRPLPSIERRNAASRVRAAERRRLRAIAAALNDRELLFTIPAIIRVNRDLTRLRRRNMLQRVPASRTLTDAIRRSFLSIRDLPVSLGRLQRLRTLWERILEREFDLPPIAYD